MTLKKYHQLRLVVTVIIAVIFSQSLILNNIFLPIVTIILAWLALAFLRRQIKEVVADERDRQIAGQSAFLTIQIYSWIATLIIFVLYFSRYLNPAFESIAFTLAYSTCFLMFTYSLIFKFHDRFIFAKSKAFYYFIISCLIVAGAVLTLRLFSGEDTWLCQNGQWVKHGAPSFPAPTTNCQ